MTEQRAIEIGEYILCKLKVEGDYICVSPKEYEEFIAEAVKALEKQIPKKPLEHFTGDEHVILCSTCKAFFGNKEDVELSDIHPQHCWLCGQRTDWSEE